MNRNISNLTKKRFEAYGSIAKASTAGFIISATPTPGFETIKELFGGSAAIAWMCWDIYKAYCVQDPEPEEFEKLVKESGILLVVTGAVGFFSISTFKTFQGPVNEGLNVFLLPGLLTAGTITGTITCVVGLAWMHFIESLYSRGK